MATKEDKPDETPTRLVYEGGITVSVPAHKAERLLKGGSFTKATAKKAAASKSSD